RGGPDFGQCRGELLELVHADREVALGRHERHVIGAGRHVLAHLGRDRGRVAVASTPGRPTDSSRTRSRSSPAARADRVRAGHVLTGDATTGFAVDWTGRFQGDAPAVVRPRDTAEVAAVLALCTDAGVPVVPQGGNTDLVGGRRGHPAAGGGRRSGPGSRDPDRASRGSATVGGAVATNAGGAVATNAGGLRVLHFGGRASPHRGLLPA